MTHSNERKLCIAFLKFVLYKSNEVQRGCNFTENEYLKVTGIDMYVCVHMYMCVCTYICVYDVCTYLLEYLKKFVES